MDAELELTRGEYNRLLRTGYCKIDDPERGEIEIRIFFDEEHPGIIKKKGRITVLRAGNALMTAKR